MDALSWVVKCVDLRSRLLLYPVGSEVTRVQVVLSGVSVIMFYFVLEKTLCRYGCMVFLVALMIGCVYVMVISYA